MGAYVTKEVLSKFTKSLQTHTIISYESYFLQVAFIPYAHGFSIHKPDYWITSQRVIIPNHNFIHKQVCHNPEVNHTQMNALANQHICDKTPICLTHKIIWNWILLLLKPYGIFFSPKGTFGRPLAVVFFWQFWFKIFFFPNIHLIVHSKSVYQSIIPNELSCCQMLLVDMHNNCVYTWYLLGTINM